MSNESLPRLLTGDVVGQVDATQVPRYAGLGTFARLPFIDEVSDVDVALVGIPFDTGVSYRPGARFVSCTFTARELLNRAAKHNWPPSNLIATTCYEQWPAGCFANYSRKISGRLVARHGAKLGAHQPLATERYGLLRLRCFLGLKILD